MINGLEHDFFSGRSADEPQLQALNLKLRGEEASPQITPVIASVFPSTNENLSALSGKDIAKQAGIDTAFFGAIIAGAKHAAHQFAPSAVGFERPSALKSVGLVVGMSALVGVGLDLVSTDKSPTNQFNDDLKKVVATGLTTAVVAGENWRVRALGAVGGMVLQTGMNVLNHHLFSDLNEKQLNYMRTHPGWI